MPKVLQIPCVDVYPPSAFKEAEQSLLFKAITLKEAVWRPGSTGVISITFGSYGCPGCTPDGAWSHIGNNSTTQYPSMNLGFIDPPFEPFTLKGKTYKPDPRAARNYCGPDSNGNYIRSNCDSKWVAGATVVHEFCHALGMMHEHQNNLQNSNMIKLDRANVIAYYNSIGLGEEGAVTNVLERYGCSENEDCKYSGTTYDKDSIMLYALPDDWVVGVNPTYSNYVLSKDDKGWLQGIYPKNINNYPKIKVQFIDPNPEPWKVAWVEKIIRETFEPLIGITWDFETQKILGTAAESTTEGGSEGVPATTEGPEGTESTSGPAGPASVAFGLNLKTEEIIGISIGAAVVGLILIIGLSVGLSGKKKKSRSRF